MKALPSRGLIAFLIACAVSGPALGQDNPVSGNVELTKEGESKPVADQANAVVWLTPISDPARAHATQEPAAKHYVLHQRHKTFTPHLLVIPVGASVEFPNHDPVFHNVFSLFEGKRFDLGLYEAGSSRTIRFDRAGVSYVFCNIHPEMGAVIIALRTPYHAISDHSGRILLPQVPPGRYLLQVWHEGAAPEALKNLQREITISDDAHSLGTMRLKLLSTQTLAHKNKYGQDYTRPAPEGGLYEQR